MIDYVINNWETLATVLLFIVLAAERVADLVDAKTDWQKPGALTTGLEYAWKFFRAVGLKPSKYRNKSGQ